MKRDTAISLLGIIQREGDKAVLDLHFTTVCGTERRGVYEVRGRKRNGHPVTFPSYESFIGTAYHDIERAEREDRERDEAAMWRNLSRTESRLHTLLSNAEAQARRYPTSWPLSPSPA